MVHIFAIKFYYSIYQVIYRVTGAPLTVKRRGLSMRSNNVEAHGNYKHALLHPSSAFLDRSRRKLDTDIRSRQPMSDLNSTVVISRHTPLLDKAKLCKRLIRSNRV